MYSLIKSSLLKKKNGTEHSVGMLLKLNQASKLEEHCQVVHILRFFSYKAKKCETY